MSYDPIKGVKKTIGMVTTESIGYGISGKIAGDVDIAVGNHIATGAFATGSALAGVPSLTFSDGNVLKSLDSLYPKKKK